MKSKEPPELFSELAGLLDWGEKGPSHVVDQGLEGHCQSSRVTLWRQENLPEGQPSAAIH